MTVFNWIPICRSNFAAVDSNQKQMKWCNRRWTICFDCFRVEGCIGRNEPCHAQIWETWRVWLIRGHTLGGFLDWNASRGLHLADGCRFPSRRSNANRLALIQWPLVFQLINLHSWLSNLQPAICLHPAPPSWINPKMWKVVFLRDLPCCVFPRDDWSLGGLGSTLGEDSVDGHLLLRCGDPIISQCVY